MIWTAWRWECILCFACTFRDIKTSDGIFTWAKGAKNFGTEQHTTKTETSI